MYAQQKTLYAVINKNNPGFVSYMSLSSEKTSCKKRFIAVMGTIYKWKYYKSSGYRVRKIIVLFQPIQP